MRGKITYDEKPLPFPEEIDNAPLVALLGGLRVTPLNSGVRETISIFKKAVADGRISVEGHLITVILYGSTPPAAGGPIICHGYPVSLRIVADRGKGSLWTAI